MLYLKCLQKYRNLDGEIEKYRLEDSEGAEVIVEAEELRKAMIGKTVSVVNLKISEDNQIVDNRDFIGHIEDIDGNKIILNEFIKSSKYIASAVGKENSVEVVEYDDYKASVAIGSHFKFRGKLSLVEATMILDNMTDTGILTYRMKDKDGNYVDDVNFNTQIDNISTAKNINSEIQRKIMGFAYKLNKEICAEDDEPKKKKVGLLGWLLGKDLEDE